MLARTPSLSILNSRQIKPEDARTSHRTPVVAQIRTDLDCYGDYKVRLMLTVARTSFPLQVNNGLIYTVCVQYVDGLAAYLHGATKS